SGLLIAGVMALVAAAFVMPAGASARGESSCELRHGPEYTFKLRGHTWKSAGYSLSGFGVSCNYMTTWVRRLAREPYAGRNSPVARGPVGRRAGGAAISPGLGGRVAVGSGDCQRAAKRKSFGWDDTFGSAVIGAPAAPLPSPAPEPAPPNVPPDQP